MNPFDFQANIKNLTIKLNNEKTKKYKSIIENKKKLKISIKNNKFKLGNLSIQKIFSLNKEDLLENIIFIYDKNNLNLENEETTFINSIHLDNENIFKKKTEKIILYIYFILSIVIFFHLFTFVFSQFFVVNIYLIICVLLSENFFVLGYFYFEKINEPECFFLHFKYVKSLSNSSLILILINIFILIIPFLQGNDLSEFIKINKVNFIVTYCFIIPFSCITYYYELYYLKRKNRENKIKEVIITSELSL